MELHSDIKQTENDWNIDMSATFGGNKILYTVGNTFNSSLGASSPINFKPGGFRFNNIVGNIDVTKRFSESVALAFGTEARREEYEIYAGDYASYYQTGAISFRGFLRMMLEYFHDIMLVYMQMLHLIFLMLLRLMLQHALKITVILEMHCVEGKC